MPISASLVNWGLLICLVMLWGTSFMFVSISIRSVDPLTIVFFRILLGAAVVTLVMLLKGLRLPKTLVPWLAFLAMGIVGNVLPFFLITWGQQTIDSGVAGMIMATMPLTTMVLAHFLIDGETLNRFKFIGFMFGITGVTILMGPVFEGGSRAILSGLAIFLAATSYACNSIMVRRLPRFDPMVATSGVLIAASITLWPIWYLMAPEFLFADFSFESQASVLWLGIGPTGIATIILFVVIDRAGPTFLSTINYLIPVVAFLCGAILLAEPISWHSFVALAVILTGIALTRFKSTQNPTTTRNAQ